MGFNSFTKIFNKGKNKNLNLKLSSKDIISLNDHGHDATCEWDTHSTIIFFTLNSP